MYCYSQHEIFKAEERDFKAAVFSGYLRNLGKCFQLIIKMLTKGGIIATSPHVYCKQVFLATNCGALHLHTCSVFFICAPFSGFPLSKMKLSIVIAAQS